MSTTANLEALPYMRNLFYDLAKNAVARLTWAMARELSEDNLAAVAVAARRRYSGVPCILASRRRAPHTHARLQGVFNRFSGPHATTSARTKSGLTETSPGPNNEAIFLRRPFH